MSMLRLLILPVFVAGTMCAQSPAEEKLADAIKSPQTTVVHLWAPWCSNCQAELKTDGWTKMINENPQVKFYFVSVWNDGQDGRVSAFSQTRKSKPGWLYQGPDRAVDDRSSRGRRETGARRHSD